MTVTSGIFIGIVGASGVGKDTLISGAKARISAFDGLVFPQRIITRPADAGGEEHIGVDDQAFNNMKSGGEFCVSWQAHGLHYGLPASIHDDLSAGLSVVCNISRAVAGELSGKFQRVSVVEITAPAEVIAARLRNRGRETSEDINKRLKRTVIDWKNGIHVTQVCNNATGEEGIDKLTEVLLSLSGQTAQPT